MKIFETAGFWFVAIAAKRDAIDSIDAIYSIRGVFRSFLNNLMLDIASYIVRDISIKNRNLKTLIKPRLIRSIM